MLCFTRILFPIFFIFCMTGCGVRSSYFDPDLLTEIPPGERQLIELQMKDRQAKITTGRMLFDVSVGSQQMRAVCVFNGTQKMRVELFPATLAVSSALLVKNNDKITVIKQLEKKRMVTSDFAKSLEELIAIPIDEFELMILLTGNVAPSYCRELQSLDSTRAVCSNARSVLLISKSTGRVLSLEHFNPVGTLQLRGTYPAGGAAGEHLAPDEIVIELPLYDTTIELSLVSATFNTPISDKIFVIP